MGVYSIPPREQSATWRWRSVLEPVIERYRDLDVPRFFRADAAFAIPDLYELLESRGYRYAIRLKANPVLERHIAHLLTRPWAARRTSRSGSITALRTRPSRGIGRAAWWPRFNGIRVTCSRAWASS